MSEFSKIISYEKRIIQVLFGDYHINSSVMMNAAAPDGAPPLRISDKKLSYPPCLGGPEPGSLVRALVRTDLVLVPLIIMRFNGVSDAFFHVHVPESLYHPNQLHMRDLCVIRNF